MATIWGLAESFFFISQSSGSESYAFFYLQLALDLGNRTILILLVPAIPYLLVLPDFIVKEVKLVKEAME
jgi:hypothetical protein